MADSDPTLAKLTSIEDLLRDVLTGRKNTYETKGGEKVLLGSEDLTKALENLNENMQENTRHLGTLTSLMGGRRGGNTAVNGQAPSPGGIGASSFRLNYDPASESAKEHLRYGNIPRAISTAVNGIVKDNRTLGYLGGAINNATGAVPSIRDEWNNINARMQSSVDRRITNPTQLGMASGLQGPGSQNVSSSAGSYFSSMFAAPSMVLSGGMNPNKIGSLFGQSMSPATSQGWQSQYRAFTRSLNPFDMLSNTQALGVNQAVAKKGFANMGQQINIEQAVTDIVQSVGVDAGAAIDTMDLAVKRLHMSVSDASEILKDFGGLAIGAGKGVSQFTQEANAVTAGISAKGALGQGAQMAGAAYSSFSQVSGQTVSSFLNGPQMGGLMAAQIMGGGGKFANQKDIMMLALGNPQGMAGGKDALGVFGQQVDTVGSLVNTFKKQGMNENVAIQMAASMTGQEFLTIKQIYKQGPLKVEQYRSLDHLKSMQKGYEGVVDDPTRRGKRAMDRLGMGAFNELKKMAHGQSWMDENTPNPFGRSNGIDFNKINLGDQNDPNFQQNVEAIYEARINKDKPAEAAAIEQAGNGSGPRAREAAKLLEAASLGDKGAWKKLNSKFGLRMSAGLGAVPKGTGYMGSSMGLRSWNSTDMDPKYKAGVLKKFTEDAKAWTDEAMQNKLITGAEHSQLMAGVKEGRLDPKKLYNKVMDIQKQKSIMEQGGIQLMLTGDAKKYFKMFSKAGGSSQSDGTLAVEVPAGTNNRNMGP